VTDHAGGSFLVPAVLHAVLLGALVDEITANTDVRACDYDTGVCSCDRRSTCRAPKDGL